MNILPFFTPTIYCITVIAAFIWFEKNMTVQTTSQDHSSINHMIDSNTNIKYVIVHNIGFIILFFMSVITLLLSVIDCFVRFPRIDYVGCGFVGLIVCYEIKRCEFFILSISNRYQIKSCTRAACFGIRLITDFYVFECL